MKAHFILNGAAQLAAYASQIGPDDMVVCSIGMTPTQIRAAGVQARLFAYFNADSVPLYGATNPTYQALRAVMLRRVYQPYLFDGAYTNAPLIKPTPGAADDYAKFIVDHVQAVGWDGAYGDQSWKTKPNRFVALEAPHYHTNRTAPWAQREVRLRWSEYITGLWTRVSEAGIELMLNCAGDLPIRPMSGIYTCLESGGGGLDPFAKLLKAPGEDTKVLWYGGPDMVLDSEDGEIIEGVEIFDAAVGGGDEE